VSDKVWHRLGAEADIGDGQMMVHAIGGWQVLLARSEGELVAINDRCTHAASRLSTGRIRRGAIMCPLHGARFDLADGRCIGGAYPAVRQFGLRVVDGMVEVEIPTRAPGMDETPVEV
jgi:nitrite reductase/ring-hydroxylating ferredoxin subunit